MNHFFFGISINFRILVFRFHEFRCKRLTNYVGRKLIFSKISSITDLSKHIFG